MRRTLILAVPVLVASTVLAGCGSPTPVATTPARVTSPAKPAPTPTPDPFAGRSGRQILRTARHAAGDASSVHLKGGGLDRGRRISFDLHVQYGKAAYGTIDLGRGGPMQIRRVGKTMYVKGSVRFWRANGMATRPAMLFGGDWIKGSTAGPAMRDLLPAVSRSLLDDNLRAGGKVTRVKGITVGGIPTVGLRYRNGGDMGILYVAVRGPALPLRAVTVGHARNPGRFTLSQWNEPVRIGAPRNAFDFDRLARQQRTTSCGCAAA